MIKQHLDRANELLNELIELTLQDIENIKIAKHDGVQDSVNEKNKLIGDFVMAKKNLDLALLELNEKSNGNLGDALDELDKEKLDLLKENLQKLHAKNKEYAKLVLVVKDFLDGLVNKMFKNDINSYANKSVSSTPESLFKLNV